MPFFRSSRGALATALGHWEISSILQASTGGPADVVLPTDNSNTGGFLDRPDLIGNPNTGPKKPEGWLNTAAFARPAPFTRGTAGRNIIEGPGYSTVDLSLLKNFPIRETKRIQFRAEFFNLLNKANFDLPNTTFDTGAFGTIGYAGDSRQIQFALRFEF